MSENAATRTAHHAQTLINLLRALHAPIEDPAFSGALLLLGVTSLSQMGTSRADLSKLFNALLDDLHAAQERMN